MKRMLILALAAAACARSPRPVIESFTVDEPNPDVGTAVQFSYSVRGAQTIRIEPAPGIVHASPVSVVPLESGTYTLHAVNDDGLGAAQGIPITLRPRFAITTVDAFPGQVGPGSDVTLAWRTVSAERATITDPGTGQVTDVAVNGSTVVRPAITTVYTLTAYNRPGRTPASVTANVTARVAPPTAVSGFTAIPAFIIQGDATTLSWSGNATSYSITNGTSTFNVGPRRTLIVRPAATTIYTLNAIGPGGPLLDPPKVTVTVEPHPATSLLYTAPADAALRLVADSCTNPACTVVLRIHAQATVSLRGLALNLPLDTTKVSFNPATFTTGIPGAVVKAAMGTGTLEDTLVLGIALPGTGTAPAQDVTVNAGNDLARFELTLLSAGGRGVVFDGAALAATPTSAFKASVQSAPGRAGKAIAVGKLETQ
jgi:hypothetical protein